VSVTPDVVPWVANGHKSTTAQQFREGIKQLGLTHPKISAHSDAGQYTASGQFMAPLNTPYNPQASKACCTAKCNSADCQHGCDMWLHTSSLNWESTKWWAVLEKKCQRDCMQSAEWKKVDAKTPNASWRNQMHQSYWTADANARTAPSDIAVCQDGCKKYRSCMNAGGVSQYAPCTCANGYASKETCLRNAEENCNHCDTGYYKHTDGATGRSRCLAATCENGVVSVVSGGEAAAAAVAAAAAAHDGQAEIDAVNAAAAAHSPTHDPHHWPICTCNAGFVGGGRWIGGSTFPSCDPQ